MSDMKDFVLLHLIRICTLVTFKCVAIDFCFTFFELLINKIDYFCFFIFIRRFCRKHKIFDFFLEIRKYFLSFFIKEKK